MELDRRSQPAEFLPLTPAVLHILLALADGPRHGYRIMKDIARMSEGAVSLGPGSLYGAIERMTESGLIERAPCGEASVKPSRRRSLRITALGRQTLLAESDRLHTVLMHVRRMGFDTGRQDL